MPEELSKQIEEAKKIIETLPENNKENRQKKMAFLANEEMKSLGLLTAITKELQLRSSKFNSLTENKNIASLEEELGKCSVLDEWNEYNNAYEKTHLDYYLYQLQSFYKKDLTEVNNCIRKILEIFNSVGVTIEEDDLYYHPYVKQYVMLIQKNASEEELNKNFEQFYWKLPELITAIDLNFKSIYLKNEKKIDKYFETKKKAYLEKHSEDELKSRKDKLIRLINQTREKDPFYIFTRFVNKEYVLNDFKEEEIKKKKQFYFTNMECTYEGLLEFYQVLYDYKLILTYGYLFKDLQELLGKITTLKDAKKESLKKIQGAEKELQKVVKVKKGLFGKPKNKIETENGLVKYKEILNKILESYNELEQTYFYDILLNRFPNTSTVANALELVSLNYLYFVKKIKEHTEGIDLENINKEYEELKHIVNSNNFALINKILLLDEYQLKQVIADKYVLDGVKLTTEQLEEGNIDKTINDIKILINYENILRSGLKLEDVKMYFDVKDLKI